MTSRLGRLYFLQVLFGDVSSGEGGVAYREVLLNRPRALNALNLNMIHLILPQMKVAAEDPSVAMVVMEGRSLC